MNLPFGFSMEADFNGNGLLFLSILILGSSFIFLMNKPRGNKQTLMDTLQSWLIPFTRMTALMILLLLIFSPEISLTRAYSIPKRVAIVVDQSSSMKKAWEGGVSELQASIARVVDKLESTHDVDIWSMDGERLSLNNLGFAKKSSVFEWKPQLANASNLENIYSSLFLITDGHLNGGRSPLDLEWSKNIEMNVVYPLQPKSNESLKLANLNYYSDETDQGSIMIHGKMIQDGLVGRRARLEIRTESNQLLSEEIFQINQAFQDIGTQMHLGNSSNMKLKVKLATENDSHSDEKILEVEQAKSKTSVLIISERVNDLHKFLVRSFVDSTYQLQVILGTKTADMNAELSTFAGGIDLLILNSPGKKVFLDYKKNFPGSTENLNIPTVLFYSGEEPLYAGWRDWLGLDQGQSNSISLVQTSFWSERAADHPFYLGLLGRAYPPGDLINYAPLEMSTNDLNVGGGELLKVGNGSLARSALSLKNNPPLAVFEGRGYWRWFFHPQSKSSFEKLWEYLITYLQEIAEFEPVTIDIPVQTATTGSYIVADISIRDIDNRRIQTAELRVWQEDGSGTKTALNLTRNDWGLYQAQLNTKTPGNQYIIAEAYRFGELWGRDTSRIELMSFNGEDQSRGVNKVFLSRLASRSGGKIIQLGEDELPEIPIKMVQRESSFQFKGVHSIYLFSILLILFTFEWIWRRRRGLL